MRGLMVVLVVIAGLTAVSSGMSDDARSPAWPPQVAQVLAALFIALLVEQRLFRRVVAEGGFIAWFLMFWALSAEGIAIAAGEDGDSFGRVSGAVVTGGTFAVLGLLLAIGVAALDSPDDPDPTSR
jgi:hypothetical protein